MEHFKNRYFLGRRRSWWKISQSEALFLLLFHDKWWL